MIHKVGLVKITLGTRSAATTRTYSTSGTEAADATGMRYTDSNETTTITASNSFDASCSPYNPSSSNYWYIVRGSNADNIYQKTFKSVTTVNTDWEYADVSVEEGHYLNITVNNTYIKRAMFSFVALFDFVAYEATKPDTDPPVTYPSGLGQSFKAPLKGTYTLKVWGAQGGNAKNYYNIQYYGGYGSYSVGDVTIAKNTDLYIYVGGQGCIFNGGAWGYNMSMPGSPCSGGATHVALADGELATLSSQRSNVLIVAGGGGGSYGYSQAVGGSVTNQNAYSGNGAHAGGIQGNKGIAATSNYYWLGTGGTQTSGGNINDHPTGNDSYDRFKNDPEYTGDFGHGGTSGGSGGGGGGGWYGGAHSHYGGGAGGSGYIGNTLLSNKHMTGYSVTTSTAAATKTNSVTNVSATPTDDYAKQGNGYCKISCTPTPDA